MSHFQGIGDHVILPYPSFYLERAQQLIPRRYRKLAAYKSIMASYPPEVQMFYDDKMRVNLLKYLLMDPYERERLNIQTFPFDYPVLTVTAPVPWHINFCVAKNFLQMRYFLGNPAIMAVQYAWEKE